MKELSGVVRLCCSAPESGAPHTDPELRLVELGQDRPEPMAELGQLAPESPPAPPPALLLFTLLYAPAAPPETMISGDL